MANPSTLRRRKRKSASPGRARPGKSLRPLNEKLLDWLDSWPGTPGDRGEDWWSEFEADLGNNRATFYLPPAP